MLKTKLPKVYSQSAVDLSSHGMSGIAWTREMFEKFLSDPEATKVVILGGDVLLVGDDGRISYTYESWAVEKRAPTESYESYSERAREKAREYLKIMRKGDGVLISPVLTDEATAGLLSN